MSKPAIEGGTPVRSDNFLVFGAPDIREDDISEVVDTLRSGWLSTGPKAKLFEDRFAQYNGAQFAIGTNSCTAALHLSLNALDLPPGSEIITTDMTFCATVNSIVHSGLKPVIVDCELGSLNIDSNLIEDKITDKTAAILVVHFAGYPCDMAAINRIAKKHDLMVISDAAHAIETRYGGISVAKHSDLTAYSFYATKNICIGEGGMVLTDNEELADKIRVRALHGMSKNAHLRYGSSGFKHYSVDTLGYKYNMMDLTASLGLRQLDRVDENWIRRTQVWKAYLDRMSDLPMVLPTGDLESMLHRHGCHLFTPLLKLEELSVDRDHILGALIAENIGTGVHYNAIHTHPYYQESLGLNVKDFPVAQWVSERTLSLPLSSKLTDKDVDDVVEAVTKVLNYYRK